MQTVLLTDGVTKRVKDIYINLAKMKGVQRNEKMYFSMAGAVIEGEPYNPVEYAVHVRKAKSLRKH